MKIHINSLTVGVDSSCLLLESLLTPQQIFVDYSLLSSPFFLYLESFQLLSCFLQFFTWLGAATARGFS